MLRLEHVLVPMSVSHVSECPDIGPECQGPNPPAPYNHHIDQVLFETSLTAGLGLTEYLAVETRWAFRVADVSPTFSELDGTPREEPDNIHHQDQTLVDLLDPWLSLLLSHAQGPVVGNLRLGATLPLGRTEENPYALGQRGLAHEHLQAGTGTFVPIVGLGVAATFAPVTVSLGGVGFFSAYENGEGYRAPVRVYASHGASLSLLEGVLRPHAALELGHEGKELWDGREGDEGSNVRTELYASGGLAYRFYDPWTLDLTLRGRLARLTDAPSFDVPIIVSLGLSTSFDLWTVAEETPPREDGVHRSEEGGVITFEK